MSKKNLYTLALLLMAAGVVIAVPAALNWMHLIFSGNSESMFEQAGSIFTQGIIGSLLSSVGAGLWKTAITLDSKTNIHVNAQKNKGIINLLGTIIGNIDNDVNKKK